MSLQIHKHEFRVSCCVFLSLTALACENGEKSSPDPLVEVTRPQALTTGKPAQEAFSNASVPTGNAQGDLRQRAMVEHARVESAVLARADAKDAIRKAYLQAPSGTVGRAQRWKAAYYAGRLGTADAVQMLEQVALSKEEHLEDEDASETSEPGHNHLGCGSRSDIHVRTRAAIGLVQNTIKGVPGAEAAMLRVLRDSEVEVARIAGLELFGQGALSKKHIELLEGRGISAAFRRFSEEEYNRYLQIDRSTLVRADKQAMSSSTPPKLDL